MRRPWRTWRPAELQQLRSLLGQMPMPLVVEAYNRWAAGEGIPGRSVLSLRRKAHELGLSVCCGGEWVRIGTASRLLKRSRQCLWLWVRQGLVQHRHGALRRSSLVQLAHDRPHLFEGCPVEGLAELLRDAALAERLAADHPKRRARPRCKQAVQRIAQVLIVAAMLLAIAATQFYGQARAERYRKLADAEVGSISAEVRNISTEIRTISARGRQQLGFLAEQGAQLGDIADAIGSLADEISLLKKAAESQDS